MTHGATTSQIVSRWLPASVWLRTYDKNWVRGDVIGGFTAAAADLSDRQPRNPWKSPRSIGTVGVNGTNAYGREISKPAAIAAA